MSELLSLSGKVLMVPGKRYRIVFRPGNHRTDKYCVMDYLDNDSEYIYLSARPVAGTQNMPKAWFKSAIQVTKDEPIVIEKPYRALNPENIQGARVNHGYV